MAETIEPPARQDAQLGHESQLEPKPDWEPRYAGSDRLKGKVAPCFLFLACEDSSYVTGLILHPDGGDTMSS